MSNAYHYKETDDIDLVRSEFNIAYELIKSKAPIIINQDTHLKKV